MKNIILLFLISVSIGIGSSSTAPDSAGILSAARFVEDLPHLDSLLAGKQEPQKPDQKSPQKLTDDSDDLYSSGTVFRSMEMSPLVSSGMGGGLRLQLQGKLTDEIQVSGVLSDQSSPLRPQGNTRTLRDLDEVYLVVSHPKFQLTAGDYILNMNYGKFMNINRNLIGIKSDFKSQNLSGSVFFAGVKGQYREMKIKGEDGNQGPYMLAGNLDFQTQAIVPGSEKVWLDGELLVRGSNHDYTIDYSTGELIFEAQHLLHSDSDIFIEYESTDFQYRRNTAGSSIALTDGGKFFEVHWIREFDDPSSQGSGLSDADISLIQNSGDASVFRSAAVEDSSGLYVSENGIFMYDPDGMELGTRYRVSFILDRNFGEYTRNVTSDGALFYSYVPGSDRAKYIDLYSASRELAKPENHHLFQFRSGLPISQNQTIKVDLGLSSFDQNRLSSSDDSDNGGSAVLLELEGKNISLGSGLGFDYTLSEWRQGSAYKSMGRDRDVTFSREWNLSEEIKGEEKLTAFKGIIHLPWAGTISSSYQRFVQNKFHRNRIQSSVSTSTKWVPEFKANLNQVSGGQDFRQGSLLIKALPGTFHPFVEYQSEFRELSNRWQTVIGGFEWEKHRSELRLGIGKRIDFEFSESLKEMELAQSAIFGEFDFSGKTGTGWTNNIQIRKRISENSLQNSKTNVSLAHVRSHFRRKNHPIRFDFKLKREERLGSGRAMVYDSVGAGLGGFRYDEEFDAFVEDANGSFMRYAVATGDRHPVTAFGLSEWFEFDFNRSRFGTLKGIKIRLNLIADLVGRDGNQPDWFTADLGTEDIERSRWMARAEFFSRPALKERQTTFGVVLRRDFNGLDPRGNDLIKHQEVSVLWKEGWKHDFWWTLNGKLARAEAASSISQFRNRSVSGGWVESGFEWRVNPVLELDANVTGGIDAGYHQVKPFKARALGLKVGLLNRLGKIGRVRAEIILNDAWIDGDNSLNLPPEALNGFSVGKTVRSQLTAHIIAARSISVNLSMNTISDSRYHNLINLRGEVRANF